MGNLGKTIVAIGFEKLPKVQKIAQSGHIGSYFEESYVARSPLSK